MNVLLAMLRYDACKSPADTCFKCRLPVTVLSSVAGARKEMILISRALKSRMTLGQQGCSGRPLTTGQGAPFDPY